MINDWDIQVNVSDILGAEPVHFSWTTEKKHRKPPAERKHQESPEEPDNATLQTVEFPSPAGSTEPVSLSADISAAGPLGLFSSGHAQTEMESPQIDQTESDIVLELQRKIASLETQLADCQQRLSKAEKENMYLLERQFSLEKIKNDNAAIIFYTGFPNYEALMSLFHYIEPKLSQMQYWKGETIVKESQPYQEDELKKKTWSIPKTYLLR